MQSESGGTVTAIFMLIPLVAVPYFAIRGTKDIQGRIPSLSGDDVAFASTDDFESTSASMDDAPPFPGDESVVMESTEPTGSEAWGDPFASAGGSTGTSSDFGNDVTRALDNQRDRAVGGLGGLVQGGVSDAAPATRELPVHRASESKVTGSTVAAKWEDGISKLKAVGMRNYRVESLRDKSMYFVTAFFPSQDGVMRRFEGQGKHPLNALESVMQQVADFRSGSVR